MNPAKLNVLTVWKEVFRLGWVMGYQDYQMTNAGSRLGRYWPTIGMAIRIAFIGTLFGLLFNSSRGDYLPWLASGWIVWGFISSAFQGSANAYISSKAMMLSLPLDKRSFVAKVIIKEGFSLLQNLPLMLIVVVLFSINLGWQILLFIPAVTITFAFLMGAGLTLGPLLARHRDIGPFLSSILGVMFFVLPIMWRPQDLGDGLTRIIVGFNPFYHYLQLVRLPLLGDIPTLLNWSLASAGALLAITIGLFVDQKTRDKVIYWA
jgi:ABC-type polysaccharide/polyol phosphate export permease